MARSGRKGMAAHELAARFEAMRETRDQLGRMCAHYRPGSEEYRVLDQAARGLERAAAHFLAEESPLGWAAGVGPDTNSSGVYVQGRPAKKGPTSD